MKYICALEIGSSKIAAYLGSFRGRELTHFWWDSTDVVGIKRGQWQDAGALTSYITQLLKNLKAKSGIKIKSVHLGIISQNIVVKHSQAVIALAERGNKSVIRSDIQRVIQQAQILGSCLEDEILHVEPLSYAVDDENEVLNPLGLYGHQLKVNLYLICARTSYINTITEIINRIGAKLDDITLSGLAVSQAVFNLQKLKGLNILCDIGKDISQILIFNDGRLMHFTIITYGGDDLTMSLSKELNLSYSLAEEVKISYGRVQYNLDSLTFRSPLRHGFLGSSVDKSRKDAHTEGIGMSTHEMGPGYFTRRTSEDSENLDRAQGSLKEGEPAEPFLTPPSRSRQSEDKLPDKEIIVKKDNTYCTLSQNSVIQILSQSSLGIAEAIADVIRPHLLAVSSPLTPPNANLLVSGRTACLDGFLELLEVVVGMPVKMAKIGNSSLLTSLMRHNKVHSGESIFNYLACLGLVAKAMRTPNKKTIPQHNFRNLLSYIPEKVQEIYREYF